MRALTATVVLILIIQSGFLQAGQSTKVELSGVVRDPSGLPIEVMRALRRPAEDRDAAERAALHDYLIYSDPALAPLYGDVRAIETARGLLITAIPHVVTTLSVDPPPTRVMPRANWMDDSAPIVEPSASSSASRSARRFNSRRADALDITHVGSCGKSARWSS